MEQKEWLKLMIRKYLLAIMVAALPHMDRVETAAIADEYCALKLDENQGLLLQSMHVKEMHNSIKWRRQGRCPTLLVGRKKSVKLRQIGRRTSKNDDQPNKFTNTNTNETNKQRAIISFASRSIH